MSDRLFSLEGSSIQATHSSYALLGIFEDPRGSRLQHRPAVQRFLPVSSPGSPRCVAAASALRVFASIPPPKGGTKGAGRSERG